MLLFFSSTAASSLTAASALSLGKRIRSGPYQKDRSDGENSY